MSKDTKQISLLIEPELYDEIKRQARRLSVKLDRDITSSEIVRSALREFLKNRDLSPFLETERVS